MGVLHQYQHYYSEIVLISVIDGGNWSIAGKSPTQRERFIMFGKQIHSLSGDTQRLYTVKVLIFAASNFRGFS
jgi:hypothetical protein